MFPHESTGDQWFSESQFESYRMLGLHTIEGIYQQLRKTNEEVPTADSTVLETFLKLVRTYVDKGTEDAAERAGSLDIRAN